MDVETFLSRKDNLIIIIKEYLKRAELPKIEEQSLNKALEILYQYSYENRLELKGLLAHTVVDSLELEYSIGEKLIAFDNSIS